MVSAYPHARMTTRTHARTHTHTHTHTHTLTHAHTHTHTHTHTLTHAHTHTRTHTHVTHTPVPFTPLRSDTRQGVSGSLRFVAGTALWETKPIMTVWQACDGVGSEHTSRVAIIRRIL